MRYRRSVNQLYPSFSQVQMGENPMTIEQRIEALEKRCKRLSKTLVGVGTLALFAVVAGTAGWTVAYTGAISPSSITRKRFTYRIKPERFGFVSMGQLAVSKDTTQPERRGFVSKGQPERSLSMLQTAQRFIIPNRWEPTSTPAGREGSRSAVHAWVPL